MLREKKDLLDSLQKQIDGCMLKLGRANKIISGLAGEKSSWTETVVKLGESMNFIIGNTLVAAGMMAYGGPFTAIFRQALEEEWRDKIKSLGLPLKEGISMK